MKKTVDARGLSCPQPVVLTLKALDLADEVTTLVDNQAAVENVTRLAHSKGCSVEVSEKEDGIYLTLKRGGAPAEPAAIGHGVAGSTAEAPAGPLVVFVPSDCFGRGPSELGERLMGAFFHSLLEVRPKPQTIIFMNSGVKLVAQGSRALDDLEALAAQGIDVLACGTCLGYFELTEKLAVGRVSNMYDIATALLEAGKVVEL
ncbi:MAG TPA: sulfurtransferase-like selenium metabolism protein YedF [Myxococcota bacterium]|nr:sulfurtransferase-like selenium metabolism protein YedF [Myxococcota bacterium]HRY92029.1 sulfurtransferase-like selenium metabolism protein YedF [Myxococcota bacterium]HSA21076.1 sulfurtransferase-like selenium metabolism protein YedF [Myxococcota bacterium]